MLMMLFSEPFESSKAMAGPVSKGVTKISKSTSNGTLKQGNRSVSFCLLTFFSVFNLYYLTCFVFLKRAVPTKGSSQITSVHDIAIQSQALLNTKDSNKVG